MDDLVVDGQLAAAVVDDHHADAATTIGEGVVEPRPQATLVDHRKALLHITSFGHSNYPAIITDIKNAILLEDGAKHVLDNDGWRRIGDKAGFLVKLLGEKIDAEIAVLASLGRSRDANDLTRAALED